MTTSEPRHRTTIEQDGQLIDVETNYTDHSQGKPWEDLDAEECEWWIGTLSDLHEARVELELIPDAGLRNRMREILADEECDLEDEAGVIRRAIDAALTEGIKDTCNQLLNIIPSQDAPTQAALTDKIRSIWIDYLEETHQTLGYG